MTDTKNSTDARIAAARTALSSITIVREHATPSGAIVLARKGGRWAIAERNDSRHQYTALNYHPLRGQHLGWGGGGYWCADATDSGLDYVADWVSETTARRRYRALVAEAEERAELLAGERWGFSDDRY